MFCAFSAAAQMAKDSFKAKSGTVIMFESFDKKYYETLEYLRYMDRQITGCLNSSAIKNKYTCQLFILDSKVKNDVNIIENRKMVNIYVNKNFRTAKNKFTVITKIINAMLLAKAGFRPTEVKVRLPEWLIVGIYGRTELRFSSHSILPVSYFPGLKALCQEEKLPDFRIAIGTPLSPENDGTAYELYEEFCRFILLEIKGLSVRSDNPVADMVFLSARKRYSSSEVFNSTITRAIIKSYDKMHRRLNKKYDPVSLSDVVKVQKWFKKIAEKRLINLNSPLQTKFFEKRFRRFRTFTYYYKPKGKPPERMTRDIVKINEIFDKYGMNPGFKEMMRKKFIEIDALVMVCQPLSIKHVERIREVMGQFDDMSSVIIRVRIEKALAALKQSLEKQQKIEDYLRKIEYATASPGNLYRNELIEDKRLSNKFSPAINNYLDKVEKTFLKD
jgi:hypothetical protein